MTREQAFRTAERVAAYGARVDGHAVCPVHGCDHAFGPHLSRCAVLFDVERHLLTGH